MERKVLKIWETEGFRIEKEPVFVAISEDRQWWAGSIYERNVSSGNNWLPIEKKESGEGWELTRQHLINVLLPELESPLEASPHNDLDRFAYLLEE